MPDPTRPKRSPEDIARIRRNVDKMQRMGASQAEIDSYLTDKEGLRPKASAVPGNVDLRQQAESTAVHPARGSGKPQDTYNATEAGLHGGVQGATFNLGDEAMAAGGALADLVTGNPHVIDRYHWYRDAIRKEFDTSAKEHPVASTVGNVVGGLAPAIATAGIGAPAAEASAGAKILSVLGQGGAFGAMTGVGTAKELRDVPKEAAESGGAGALGALLLHGSGSLASAGARALGVPDAISRAATGVSRRLPSGRLADMLESVGASTGSAGEANRAIAGRLTTSGNSPRGVLSELGERTARSGVKPELLADYDPEVANLTKAVTKKPGAGRAQIVEAIRSRSSGTRGRVVGDLEGTTGVMQGEARPQLEAMVRDRANSAAEHFPAAMDSPAKLDDPAVQKLLQRPTFQAVYRDAQRLASDEGRKLPTNTTTTLTDEAKAFLETVAPEHRSAIEAKFLANPATTTTTHTPVPDVATMAYMDRALRRMVEEGYAGKGPLLDEGHAAVVQREMGQIRDALADLSPEYADALADYASRSGPIDAMETGLKAFNYAEDRGVPSQALGAGDPLALKGARRGITGLETAVRNMNPEESGAFRTGASQAVYDKIAAQPASKTGSTDAVLNVLKDSPKRQRFQDLLFQDPADGGTFSHALGRERTMATTNTMLNGSDTAANLAESQSLSPKGGLLSALRKPFQAALGVAGDAANEGVTTRNYAALGDRLSRTGPLDLQALAEELQASQFGDRLTARTGGVLRNALVPQLPFVGTP